MFYSLLETSNRNPAEIARHLREREDVNGLPVSLLLQQMEQAPCSC